MKNTGKKRMQINMTNHECTSVWNKDECTKCNIINYIGFNSKFLSF